KSASLYLVSPLALDDALPICEGVRLDHVARGDGREQQADAEQAGQPAPLLAQAVADVVHRTAAEVPVRALLAIADGQGPLGEGRSEEHTSELQSRENLVCRLL